MSVGRTVKIKTFNVRMPVDLWAFLKKDGVDQEKSLNQAIVDLATVYRKKKERILTSGDAKV